MGRAPATLTHPGARVRLGYTAGARGAALTRALRACADRLRKSTIRQRAQAREPFSAAVAVEEDDDEFDDDESFVVVEEGHEDAGLAYTGAAVQPGVVEDAVEEEASAAADVAAVARMEGEAAAVGALTVPEPTATTPAPASQERYISSAVSGAVTPAYSVEGEAAEAGADGEDEDEDSNPASLPTAPLVNQFNASGSSYTSAASRGGKDSRKRKADEYRVKLTVPNTPKLQAMKRTRSERILSSTSLELQRIREEREQLRRQKEKYTRVFESVRMGAVAVAAPRSVKPLTQVPAPSSPHSCAVLLSGRSSCVRVCVCV